MSWTPRDICTLNDVPDPGARGFSVGDCDWPFAGFVVRNGDILAAYLNRCPHQQHPLDLDPDAFLDEHNELIRCSSHGALFDIASGHCVAGPCPGRSLTKLDCYIEDGKVMVVTPGSMREVGKI
jgi:nitrite reductase/ring-hydroxylating ferredoxin subunit